MIEKIIKGYKWALIDLKACEGVKKPLDKYNGVPFIVYHKKLCGKDLYSTPSKIGGVIAWLTHPVKGYNAIKKQMEYNSRNPTN